MQLFARWAVLVAAALAACASGCARNDAARFTPPAETATQCVEAALAAWRDGRPMDALATEKPAICVVDTLRRPDQRLQAFEVLSKSPASAAGWTYVVRLTFDKPAAPERARFVVVGVDPIWVFRKEDYDHLAHWEHPMPEPLPASETLPAIDSPAATPAGASAGERPVSAAPPVKSDET